jgi:polyisoprenoid-binding protein YceI
MKIVYLVLLLMGTGALPAAGQNYITEESFISFYSHAPIEDIKAENEKAVSLFNAATGDVAFSVPIKEYQFRKSLMQEHFNEKYMESEKYPKSTFQGKITGFNPQAKGIQQVSTLGKLTIHGVTKEVHIKGTIEKLADKLNMKSTFIVKLEDYNIAVPSLLRNNIAEQVEVTIDFVFKPQ